MKKVITLITLTVCTLILTSCSESVPLEDTFLADSQISSISNNLNYTLDTVEWQCNRLGYLISNKIIGSDKQVLSALLDTENNPGWDLDWNTPLESSKLYTKPVVFLWSYYTNSKWCSLGFKVGEINTFLTADNWVFTSSPVFGKDKVNVYGITLTYVDREVKWDQKRTKIHQETEETRRHFNIK